MKYNDILNEFLPIFYRYLKDEKIYCEFIKLSPNNETFINKINHYINYYYIRTVLKNFIYIAIRDIFDCNHSNSHKWLMHHYNFFDNPLISNKILEKYE